jgi:hypothetical protein
MERPAEIVTREELRRRLWLADTFVDFEVALNSAVSRLRDALGDSAVSRPAFWANRQAGSNGAIGSPGIISTHAVIRTRRLLASASPRGP